ncbi:MAG: hypothetical protein HYV75_01520 [Opitutae bacterium]|nr:hypothetical protein [Opitutae bacterium]
MANWEYKVISSGKGGFASPALMEKFINDLGQEQWEIINFHTAPDNPLAFTGLARRPVTRDWTLEDAAAAAARAETDKLRLEFEAKFKAATTGAPAAPAEEQPESLIEEKAAADDGFRRPKDTSRDDDPDAPEGDWEKLAAEDELPTFFDALKPHMRQNQRGPGKSVGVDFLAKKWKMEEAEIKGALVECGLQIPADENAKPVYVEYDGDLYWVNINRRGETWINAREKPEPVFRIVQGTPVAAEDAPADTAPAPSSQSGRREERREERQRQPQPAQPPREDAGAPKTLLARIRGMMRRNRRGHGWSGSFPYLTKALKVEEAGLLAQLAESGLRLEGGTEPVLAEENGFTYWLNRNQRGEIWINAEEKREQRAGSKEQGARESVAGVGDPGPGSASPATTPAALPPENILTAVRLLMQPKKRGEGVTAQVRELAEKLEKSDEQVLALLATTGLHRPESPKAKPTFAEHGGEIYWLNVNAKGQVWLNAKAAKKTKAKPPAA